MEHLVVLGLLVLSQFQGCLNSYLLLFRWCNGGESARASIVEDLAITFKLAHK